MSLLELFCDIDDFWQMYESVWHQMLLEKGLAQRRRTCQMTMSELMTIVIHFHPKRFRDVKTYYTEYVMIELRAEFPTVLSYSRFIQLMPRILLALCAYLVHCYGRCSGIAFIDSTALAVCHNRRIHQHGSLTDLPSGDAHRSIGSMGSSCTWSSMIREKFSVVA